MPEVTFLGIREEWANRGPCGFFARGVESPGEESLADGVAAQAFEAKPVTGLDLANQRHRVSPALNNKAGEPRLASLITFKSAKAWSEQ